MKDVLAERDGQNATDKNAYASTIAAANEAAVEQDEDLQRAVQDNSDASNKRLTRLADSVNLYIELR